MTETPTTLTCRRCQIVIDPEVDSYSDTRDAKGQTISAACSTCRDHERVEEYEQTGLLTSGLTVLATLADCRKGDTAHLREEVVRFYREKATILEKVMTAHQKIRRAAKLLEISLWLGRPDIAEDVTETVCSLRLLQAVPDIPESALVKYYDRADKRGHHAHHPRLKVLLWGSAGRVLLTLQDKFGQGNPRAAYDGAHLTLIFEEGARQANGGVHSLCGTEKECLAILRDAQAAAGALVFLPDTYVRVAI